MKIWKCAAILAMAAAVAAAEAPAGDAPAKEASTTDLSPTLVTLHHKKVPGSEAFKDLARQMNLEFLEQPGNERKIWPDASIDAEKRPYWEVVNALSDQLNLNYLPARQDGKLRVGFAQQSWNMGTGVRYVSGPVLVIARGVEHGINYTMPTGHFCGIRVTLFPEPTMKLAAYYQEAPEEAVDENGLSLLPTKPLAPEIKYWILNYYSEIMIPLEPRKNSGRQIARVKGSVRLHLVDDFQKIEIPATQGDTEMPLTIGGASATLTFSHMRFGCSVTVQMNRDKLSDNDWKTANDLLDSARSVLEDAKGTPYYVHTPTRTREDKVRKYRVTFQDLETTGEKPGPAAKYTMTLPKKIREAKVPYEFKDLPLP